MQKIHKIYKQQKKKKKGIIKFQTETFIVVVCVVCWLTNFCAAKFPSILEDGFPYKSVFCAFGSKIGFMKK